MNQPELQPGRADTMPPGNGDIRDRRCYTFAARWRAFRDAGRGVRLLLINEPHAWVHLIASIAVVTLGVYLDLPASLWIALILAMGLVWTAEALNTALERLCDIVEPNPDERIARVKDIAAGGVLLASLAAAAVGAWIFLPRLFT